MKLGDVHYLRAGNVWCRHPVVRFELTDEPGAGIVPEGFRDRLLGAADFFTDNARDFPAWRDLETGPQPKSAAAYVAVLAVLLQRSLYWPVRFVASDDDAGAAVEARVTGIGRKAIEAAAEIVSGLLDGAAEPTEFMRQRVQTFYRAAGRKTPAFDTLALATQADARGIPWETLPRASFVRFGQGRHAKMLYCSESSDAPLMAKRIAKVKPLTSALLSEAGLPVARHKAARTLKGALAAAAQLGGPVVIKPAKGRQGFGITVGAQTPDEIERAVKKAQAIEKTLHIEEVIPGDEYRLLVIGGQFAAACQRLPAHVVGDGKSTVEELVAEKNAAPLRFPMPNSRHSLRHPIKIDREAETWLARQDLDPQAVPAQGRIVPLRGVSNVSQGGDSIDVTDRVHPSIRQVAEQAAKVLNLDACGVDFITTDIGKPYQETGGAICELNTQPGLSLHHVVDAGTPQDVAGKYLGLLFPEDRPVRVPTVVLVDLPRGTGPRRAIRNRFAARGLKLGVFAGRRSHAGASAAREGKTGPVLRFDTIKALLKSVEIDAALVVLKAHDILSRGAGIVGADLAVIPDALAEDERKPLLDALTAIVGPDNIVGADEVTEAQVALALGLGDKSDAKRKAATRRRATPRPSAPSVRVSEIEASETAPGFRAVFMGDVGFGESYLEHPRSAALRRLSAKKGHAGSLERLTDLLEGADFRVANLEVPLSWKCAPELKDRKKYLGWCDPERTVSALQVAGLQAVTLANNHSLDCGSEGLDLTRTRLQEAGIDHFGAGGDERAAGAPLIRCIEVGGRRMNLVLFAGFQRRPRYERGFSWYAAPGKKGVAPLDPEAIGRHIAELRETLVAPVFVAYPHWGSDYRDVTRDQEALARALVLAGCDLVIGHGAHIVQRVELLVGKPVVYGLGNFVWNAPGRFSKRDAPPFGLSCALDINGPGEASLKLYPLLTDTQRTGYRNRPVTGAEFREVEALIAPGLVAGRLARRGERRAYYLELVQRGGTWSAVVA